jgi:antitoxin HicB
MMRARPRAKVDAKHRPRGYWSKVVTVHQYRYTVLFEPAEEGGYVVTCPALPGLVTEGDTLEEARDMAADAIRGYLESLAKDGLPIPPEDAPASGNIIKEAVEVAIEQE